MKSSSARTKALRGVVLLVVGPFLSPDVRALSIETVEKGEIVGRSLSISGNQVSLLKLPIGEEKFQTDEIVRIRFSERKKTQTYPQVILRNGDLVSAEPISCDGKSLEVYSGVLGKLSLPLAKIKLIAFEKAQPVQETSRDLLVLKNGDAIRGALKKISDRKLTFETDTELGTLELPLSTVKYLRLADSASEAQPEPEFLLAETTLADGSFLTARLQSLEFPDGTTSLKLLFGQFVEFPSSSLTEIRFKNGRLVYLSDIKPVLVKEIPYFDIVWKYKLNRSVGGNPLRIGNRTYERGIGVHSYCRLVYDLRGSFKTFITDIGIDEEVGSLGSVVFRILADGQELLREKRTGTDEPKTVTLDVSGVKKLELIVEFGEELDIADHADWAEARLIR